MRLIYHGVPCPRPAPLQCTPPFLACWSFCAACALATRGLCGARSVRMLIVRSWIAVCCRLLALPTFPTLVSRGRALPTLQEWSAVSFLCSDVLSAGLFVCYVLVALSSFSHATSPALRTVEFGSLTLCQVFLCVDWTLESLRSAVAVIITPYRASLSFFAYSHWLP